MGSMFTQRHISAMLSAEDATVPGAALSDLALPFVEETAVKQGQTMPAREYLAENGFLAVNDQGRDVLSVAAVLLFGLRPQQFLPRARIRVLQCQGEEIVSDAIFAGCLVHMLTKAEAHVAALLATDHNAPVLSLCTRELLVNALGHRDWAALGTDIQVRLSEDCIIVENPGVLPEAVLDGNPEYLHMAVNPRIFDHLRLRGLARELGSGLGRVASALNKAGLPPLVYGTSGFMVRATIRSRVGSSVQSRLAAQVFAGQGLASPEQKTEMHNTATLVQSVRTPLQPAASAVSAPDMLEQLRMPLSTVTSQASVQSPQQTFQTSQMREIEALQQNIIEYCRLPRTRREMQNAFAIKDRNYFLRYCLVPLLEQKKIRMTLPDRPNSPAQRYVRCVEE